MNTKVRAYCYRESSNCFLPRDVLDVIDAPQHVSQGRLIVFAPTAMSAAVALDDVYMTPHGSKLALGHGNDVDALLKAGMGNAGSVWALPMQGHAVASVYREHGGRTAVRVGEIRRQNGVSVFVSDDEPERITDAMIGAAYDAAHAHGEDIDRETVGAMLTAALDVEGGYLPLDSVNNA